MLTLRTLTLHQSGRSHLGQFGLADLNSVQRNLQSGQSLSDSTAYHNSKNLYIHVEQAQDNGIRPSGMTGQA